MSVNESSLQPHIRVAKRMIQNGYTELNLVNHFLQYVICVDKT